MSYEHCDVHGQHRPNHYGCPRCAGLAAGVAASDSEAKNAEWKRVGDLADREAALTAEVAYLRAHAKWMSGHATIMTARPWQLVEWLQENPYPLPPPGVTPP